MLRLALLVSLLSALALAIVHADAATLDSAAATTTLVVPATFGYDQVAHNAHGAQTSPVDGSVRVAARAPTNRSANKGFADFLAAKAGDEVAEAAPKLLGPGTNFGGKIEKQLPKRGWTQRLVQSTIDNPVRTVPSRDTRHLPRGGRVSDPATGYYSRRGGYVVRNDRTGDIVQVSNRLKPGWKAPWDP